MRVCDMVLIHETTTWFSLLSHTVCGISQTQTALLLIHLTDTCILHLSTRARCCIH